MAVVVVGGAVTRGRLAVEVEGPLTLPVVVRVELLVPSRRCCAKPKPGRHTAKRTSAMSAAESFFFTENLTRMLSQKP
jgi:hypothetical protein